ncbi:MAG: hypothetical protein KKE71_01335 [Nanoarchaeota archaeon]|nr:hypothetical protein [Nanoarchaeota archaeon]
MNSNSGAEEIELAGYRYLKNSELTCTEMTPKMRESVRKKLTIELRSSLRSKERLDGELFNNFNEFTKEYHNEDIEKLKKLKKSSQEYRDEMDSKLNYVDTHYGAKSNAYFVEALQKYTEHQNVNKSSDVDSSLQKNFSPLTESFAYYLNIQRGDRLKEEAKETLLENGIYAKNNKERLKYEIALRTVFKMHDEVKKYGNLSDEDALKIILPMSKYVLSVDELEKFAGDERNIKELVHYSKIASNMGGDKTDSFGEYRGLQALKHYKNTGKIH